MILYTEYISSSPGVTSKLDEAGHVQGYMGRHTWLFCIVLCFVVESEELVSVVVTMPCRVLPTLACGGD